MEITLSMPSVYSHFNRNVSSVWYLVLIVVVLIGTITWRTYLLIQKIEIANQKMVADIGDLMTVNQPR
ncbi:hypothetical protein IPJ70_01620 [Candidatus Campbellbacteria bacterium]|nr:MAG: hypothetical protein IPJ70_01620 [Candidatus Campbellbacteria bacterium]